MNPHFSSPSMQAAYLRTLPAIRERCSKVHALAQQGKLEYFDYNAAKESSAVDYCLEIMKRDFPAVDGSVDFASIPPHGRWRHLDAGKSRIAPLMAKWDEDQRESPVDDKEKCKRLIDLFLVSVLLDAGAGNQWTYRESDGQIYTRSEGLAVATVHMFDEGLFSGSAAEPHRVDAQGLSRINETMIAAAMQVSDANPMVGLSGRTSLLINLKSALESNPHFFGSDARPGNLIDFLESESKLEGSSRRVHVSSLWGVLLEGLALVWPARHSIGGVQLGDVWPCSALTMGGQAEGEDFVPFHKLTGWITYSLIEPMEKILKWKFEGIDDMTGLPEYRNGGLLIDFGILTPKPTLKSLANNGVPCLPPSHGAVIEWRAMTVIELDRIADGIRCLAGVNSCELTLAQVLESATWKGGREIAKRLRPLTGGPPIEIESDGTVF
ncbi:DUF1688-domain-containing protein [Rhizopogon vinicolor AM-OR11-026]|uniref:DUF1688-domain-containing protein n=1 Tax=Rhizopogon vinicolor AM-OR11-026 TaxID=1314800 RepID=A0A1B7N1W6_9AGAM|nr:DUF1688-domain-containing protein [Rhizopogon vinicolor AM-OR11-026]